MMRNPSDKDISPPRAPFADSPVDQAPDRGLCACRAKSRKLCLGLNTNVRLRRLARGRRGRAHPAPRVGVDALSWLEPTEPDTHVP